MSNQVRMTINELVSFNLARIRRERRMTQEALATTLRLHTGRKSWTNVTVSAAERAWVTHRTKRFDADEIVALAQIFDVPISYFFTPTPELQRAQTAVAKSDGDVEIVFESREDTGRRAVGRHRLGRWSPKELSKLVPAPFDPEAAGRAMGEGILADPKAREALFDYVVDRTVQAVMAKAEEARLSIDEIHAAAVEVAASGHRDDQVSEP